MKRKRLSYILLIVMLPLFLFPASLTAQQWYYFDGFVTDIDEGSPVSQHPVFLSNGDSLCVETTFTDSFGYYFDSLFIYGQGDKLAIVSTFDCLGEEHSYYIDEPDSSNHYNFEICTQVSGCFAFFYSEADQQNPFLVHFTDFSEGNIDSWTWDFGDGSFSFEQHPSHLYKEPGFYEVCLTINNEIDTCFDQYCEEIFVGQNDCMADFYWEPSLENALEVNFSDLSVGEIDFYSWDFGDETYSYEQSPVHEYSEEGEYWVSLFVGDSMGFCYDETWQLIHVYNDSPACQAAFNYSLDTLNNTPYVYLFVDASEGSINEWLWEFGDGQISKEQYPQHVYNEGGTYEVCLTVSSTQASKGDCFDQICQTIETPGYFNFGGQVFIDGFTINIDSTDNDNIAMAYLYRRVDNHWWYMDQREFWKYGYYWFVNKPEGEYIVRADLQEGSLDYNSFAPAYYKGSLNWQFANTFYLSNNEEYAVNIDLKKLESYESGIGSLSGYLQPGIGCSYSIHLENQLVELFNTDNKIVAFTYTDEEGYFSFSGLGFDSYSVKAEFTGNASTLYGAKIDATEPSISDIELIIDCNCFVGVDEYISENGFAIESVYPVPAVDFVNLKVTSKENSAATIFIYDLNGQIVFQKNISLNQGSQQFAVRVQPFKPGLYLLKLVSSDGKSTINQKIIINH